MKIRTTRKDEITYVAFGHVCLAVVAMLVIYGATLPHGRSNAAESLFEAPTTPQRKPIQAKKPMPDVYVLAEALSDTPAIKSSRKSMPPIPTLEGISR